MISEQNSQTAIPEQESFQIGRFHPEDAEGISQLVRSVYGEHYPIRLFYDPKAILEANQEGRYLSFVARTDSGNVVGVTHLFPSTPNPALLECGVGMVHRDYRGSGFNTRILHYIYEEYVPADSKIEAVFGEGVCNHTIQHKMARKFGFVETAIEVALMPAEAYSKENSAAGRVATMDAFRTYRKKPHRVYLPAAYRDFLQTIYACLDDRREIAMSEKKPSESASSAIDLQVFDFAGVARMAVRTIGADFAEVFDAMEKQALSRKVVVLQAWLDLGTPWVGRAVEDLRGRGYFFGGLLPRWFDSDGLLMQKLLCPGDYDQIHLFTDFSKELLAYIRKDHHRALSAQPNS
ncbi:GNAT family N-acetyltransferase [Desulfatirhabdium butyrativorans]|uniref:GNAT family N-acetyltransferase n=1 Tax=Desulfatirhabdium butyrativorans TaxID=340467 RepID=UPI0003FFCC68|nr:GNAT family N-acetyltransferase [Desulfatirhabdium butyrativorans]